MKTEKNTPSTGIRTYARADELLRTVGLQESSHTLIKDIGVGKQQMVEIAKALGKKRKAFDSG
jgi:putative multiple sugar transport system ATP-binding protein